LKKEKKQYFMTQIPKEARIRLSFLKWFIIGVKNVKETQNGVENKNEESNRSG
jgi:hypothetical protein